MSNSDVYDHLDKVIQQGIYEEFAVFYQAQATLLAIVDHATVLNASNFAELFGIWLNESRITMLLALTKILDKTDSHNRPTSIPEALRILTTRTAEITLANEAGGRAVLTRYSISAGPTKDEVILAIVRHMETRIGQVQTVIDDLKTLRDKWLAHRDRNVWPHDLPESTLGQVNQVAEVVKEFLALTGVLLFNTPWIQDGKFVVEANDTLQIMQAFRKLMHAAHLRT